jgi:ASC-1-like (ASCH) protein
MKIKNIFYKLRLYKMITHKMKLSEPYYSLVKTNKKTVEIRVYDEKRKQLSVGDKILFTKTDGSGEFRRTIKKLLVSKNFETALKRSTLRKAMPNLCKINDAVDIYHSFPNYKKDAKKNGVLSIYF